jgi:hypothetical protein
MFSPPVPILNQKNPVHTLTPYFLRSALILSSYLRLGIASGLFLSRYPTNILCPFLISPVCAISPAHITLIPIIFGEEYKL